MTVTTANSARDTESRDANENIFPDARSEPRRTNNDPRAGKPQQVKRDRRDVHGWVVLDKPIGMTSTHAVAVLKRLVLGHARPVHVAAVVAAEIVQPPVARIEIDAVQGLAAHRSKLLPPARAAQLHRFRGIDPEFYFDFPVRGHFFRFSLSGLTIRLPGP